jgi:hypothetical protein
MALMTTVLTLPVVVYDHHWSVSELDVNNIFLNGGLNFKAGLHSMTKKSMMRILFYKKKTSINAL